MWVDVRLSREYLPYLPEAIRQDKPDSIYHFQVTDDY